MAQEQDDTFGYDDPSSILQRQQDQYDQAQYRATPMQRASNAGLYGVQNLFGGGPAVTHARQVQTQLQDIMSQANAGADPNEDPITAQMRQARAISQGMIGVDPTMALRAQDQLVRLSQARQQQSLLNLKTQEAQQTLQQETRKNTIAQNTPQTLYMAEDQGTDKYGMPLGYKGIKSYDLTDSSTPAAMRADLAAAEANGQKVVPMTSEQLANHQIDVSRAAGIARIQAAVQSAEARKYATDNKPPPGGSAMNDRFTDRILAGGDMAIGGIESIMRMPMGTSRGLFVDGQFAHPGSSLSTLTGQNLRNAFTNTDSQLYNTFTAGIGNNLAAVETQGLGQGLQQLAARLQDKIQIKPGDSPIAVMGKMAEMRDTLDRGLAIKMADSKLDPAKRDEMQQMLERLHTAVPFTRNDVVGFDAASKADPGLSFSQWAAKQSVAGAATRVGLPAMASPAAVSSSGASGIPAKIVVE
jgi:hypothetical protein